MKNQQTVASLEGSHAPEALRLLKELEAEAEALGIHLKAYVKQVS